MEFDFSNIRVIDSLGGRGGTGIRARLRTLWQLNALGVQLPPSALKNFVNNAGVAQLVEHHVANVNVAGSTPVSRSLGVEVSQKDWI